MSFCDSTRVSGIDPVDGWELHETYFDTDNEGRLPAFYACRGGVEVMLQVSCYFFTPTRDRFAWLVRHDFPTGALGARGAIGPLSDAVIDAAIEAEAANRKAERIIWRSRRLAAPLAHAASVALMVCAGTWASLVLAGSIA